MDLGAKANCVTNVKKGEKRATCSKATDLSNSGR